MESLERYGVMSLIGRSLLAVALLGVLASRAPTLPVPAAPFDVWIEQLGSANPAAQLAASTRLLSQGEEALPALHKAVRQHPHPRVRKLAAEVASRIERGEIITIGNGSNYWFNRVAFTPQGRHAVVTGGAVILIDLVEGKEIRRDLELPFARIGLALSPDGKQFVTGHQNDRVVRIGDVATCKVTQMLQGHKGGVHAVAFSPNGDRVVTGSLDTTLRLWDAKTGKEIRQFPGIADQVRSVAFAADGKQILSGHAGPGSDFAVRLWDVASGKELRRLKGHTQEVTAVCFAPDGKTALSTGSDGAAIVWDLAKGKELRRMTHTGGIYGAALAPDGTRLLTAGFGDRTVRLWDVATARELKRFEGHGGAALGVAFSADGGFALSCDARATVRLWRLPK
jgi:WD40 repeat protein